MVPAALLPTAALLVQRPRTGVPASRVRSQVGAPLKPPGQQKAIVTHCAREAGRTAGLAQLGEASGPELDFLLQSSSLPLARRTPTTSSSHHYLRTQEMLACGRKWLTKKPTSTNPHARKWAAAHSPGPSAALPASQEGHGVQVLACQHVTERLGLWWVPLGNQERSHVPGLATVCVLGYRRHVRLHHSNQDRDGAGSTCTASCHKVRGLLCLRPVWERPRPPATVSPAPCSVHPPQKLTCGIWTASHRTERSPDVSRNREHRGPALQAEWPGPGQPSVPAHHTRTQTSSTKPCTSTLKHRRGPHLLPGSQGCF